MADKYFIIKYTNSDLYGRKMSCTSIQLQERIKGEGRSSLEALRKMLGVN